MGQFRAIVRNKKSFASVHPVRVVQPSEEIFMKQAELKQLETLSRIDRLIDRCESWPGVEHAWEPAHRMHAFMHRVLPRIRVMRERLESPLIVAMFGGTGTGKSSLVNAILGKEIARPGRTRPTTTRPMILVHPEINLDLLQLPINQCDLVRPAQPILEDIIIVDCPDPDTSEDGDSAGNLQRLRQFLPHCDVLIYTSTQQKYRSAGVQHELNDAAPGCKLVFVQTHADRDVDIREDWKSHLGSDYNVPEMFFIDSPGGLKKQLQNEPADPELTRLQNFLLQQLSSGNRSRIRQDNVLDLLYATLSRIRETLMHYIPALETLEEELENNSRKVQQEMSEQLQQELLSARQLWERRILESVVQQWGSTPFSWLLRLQNSLGVLVGSFGLMRARTSAFLALIGLTQGARMWKQHQQEQDFSTLLAELDDLPVHEADLRDQQLILQGYARSAGFDTGQLFSHAGNSNNKTDSGFREEFFHDARMEVDRAVEHLGKRNSGMLTRLIYDTLFLVYPGFLLYRIGRNFFWDSLIKGQEILSADFYLPAGVFLILWCGLFSMMFTRRLRRGLKREVKNLVDRMISRRLNNNLFPVLQEQCQLANQAVRDLTELEEECNTLRQLSTPQALGSALLHHQANE